MKTGKAASQLSAQRVNELLERTATLYEKTLADSIQPRLRLTELGVRDSRLLTTHRVGWSGGTLHQTLPVEGPLIHDLRRLDILKRDGSETFAGRIVFPIIDLDGRVINLYALDLELAPGSHAILLNRQPCGIWNVGALRMYSELIAVRTPLEALALQSIGLDNVIAIPERTRQSRDALAPFTEYSPRQLRFIAPSVSMWRKTEPIVAELSHGSCRLSSRNLPKGFSILRLLKENGSEYFTEWLGRNRRHNAAGCPSARPTPPGAARNESASSAVVTAVADSSPGSASSMTAVIGTRQYEIMGLEKAQNKLKATVRVTCGGRLHVDTLDFYSARSRRALVRDLALVFDQPYELIQGDALRLITMCENWDPEKQSDGDGAGPVAAMAAEERAAAEAFGRDPDLIENILQDYETCGLVGERSSKLLCYLAAVSRKMDTPLCVLLLSSSGAGKSAIQAATLAFCPGEDVVRVTSLTGKALFYRGRASLRHKALAIEEGAGVEEADYAIRSLISSGEVAIESVIRDRGTGDLKAVSRQVEGPTAVFYTVTDPQIDPETRSRFFVIGVDESRSQTVQILACQRSRQTVDGLTGNIAAEAVRIKQQNFQRLLRPLTVINPYAERLSYRDDRLQARRDQPKFLNLIRAVAFLRQMQKQVKQCRRNGCDIGYIDAEPIDLQVASELASEILKSSSDELSVPAANLLELLKAMIRETAEKAAEIGPEPPDASDITFTRRQVRAYTGWTRTRLHIHLEELLDAELAVLVGRDGHGLHRYRLVDGVKDSDSSAPGFTLPPEFIDRSGRIQAVSDSRKYTPADICDAEFQNSRLFGKKEGAG